MATDAFEARLQQARTAVETRLQALIEMTAHGSPDRFIDSLRHAVLGGGKRFRPFLVLETGRLFDVLPSAALDIAAALECVHCYSLVHDDLPAMDNDAMRRGRPSVWKAYDEWTAILAGDALLTIAFEIVSDRTELEPVIRLRLVRELARAAGAAGMVGGQAHDLHADKRGEPAQPDHAHVKRLQDMKTGALIRFACIAGPIMAGRAAGDVETFRRFGDLLGFAFQISDDLLDATGDATQVGKAVGKDAAAGKATLVSLMGVEAARAALVSVEAETLATLRAYGEEAEVLRAAARFVARRDN